MVKCCNRGKYLRCAFCMTNEHKVCPTYKPPIQTNADRIRAMTDEELADLISDPVTYSFNCGMCPANPQFGSCVHRCKPHILEWLKSEVKE